MRLVQLRRYLRSRRSQPKKKKLSQEKKEKEKNYIFKQCLFLSLYPSAFSQEGNRTENE